MKSYGWVALTLVASGCLQPVVDRGGATGNSDLNLGDGGNFDAGTGTGGGVGGTGGGTAMGGGGGGTAMDGGGGVNPACHPTGVWSVNYAYEPGGVPDNVLEVVRLDGGGIVASLDPIDETDDCDGPEHLTPVERTVTFDEGLCELQLHERGHGCVSGVNTYCYDRRLSLDFHDDVAKGTNVLSDCNGNEQQVLDAGAGLELYHFGESPFFTQCTPPPFGTCNPVGDWTLSYDAVDPVGTIEPNGCVPIGDTLTVFIDGGALDAKINLQTPPGACPTGTAEPYQNVQFDEARCELILTQTELGCPDGTAASAQFEQRSLRVKFADDSAAGGGYSTNQACGPASNLCATGQRL